VILLHSRLENQFGISGSHFLARRVVGYDVGTRFTIIVGERYESETHRSTHSIARFLGLLRQRVAQQVCRREDATAIGLIRATSVPG